MACCRENLTPKFFIVFVIVGGIFIVIVAVVLFLCGAK
jgi:hypothetical protein